MKFEENLWLVQIDKEVLYRSLQILLVQKAKTVMRYNYKVHNAIMKQGGTTVIRP